MSVTIKIDDRLLQQRLRAIEEALGPSGLYKTLDTIGQELIEQTRLNIGSGHDWQGRPFAPNSEVTLSKKRGSKPLIDSGVFLASRLFYNVSGGNAVTIGAGGVQAAVLQFGAAKGAFGRGKTRNVMVPWGTIPPRPYMPINDAGTDLVPEARERVLTIIDDFLDEATKG